MPTTSSSASAPAHGFSRVVPHRHARRRRHGRPRLAGEVGDVRGDRGASTVAFRGNASTTLDPRELSIQGPGKVVLAGDLTVVHADGSTAKAAMVTLEAGPFQLAIVPVTGGYTLQQATLQGVIQMG